MYSILCVRCWLNDQIKQNLTSKSFIPDAARAGKSPCIKNIFYQLYLSLIQILQYMKCMKWSEEDSAEDIVALKKNKHHKLTVFLSFFFNLFGVGVFLEGFFHCKYGRDSDCWWSFDTCCMFYSGKGSSLLFLSTQTTQILFCMKGNKYMFLAIDKTWIRRLMSKCIPSFEMVCKIYIVRSCFFFILLRLHAFWFSCSCSFETNRQI